MGFLGSCTNVIPPEGSAMTWFVMSTAMLYSSLICGSQLGVFMEKGQKVACYPQLMMLQKPDSWGDDITVGRLLKSLVENACATMSYYSLCCMNGDCYHVQRVAVHYCKKKGYILA
jgi:hypothetical protein